MRPRRAELACVLAACMALAGCADYMSERDSISLRGGNAMEANMAIHAIDAFPRNRNDTHIRGSGKRALQAQSRYEGAGAAAAPPPPQPVAAAK